MAKIETMRVVVRDGGHSALINVSDFNPAKHAKPDEPPHDEDDPPSVHVDEDEDDSAAFEAATPKKSRRGRK